MALLTSVSLRFDPRLQLRWTWILCSTLALSLLSQSSPQSPRESEGERQESAAREWRRARGWANTTVLWKQIKPLSIVVVVVVESLSRVRLFAAPWTVAYQVPHPWDFPGKSTGVGCHFLLQRIFPTQGLNPGLPHCRQMLYRLSYQGSHCPWPDLIPGH